MSTEYEREKHLRRRPKTHGFFDHGDSSLYPKRIRFADRPKEPVVRKSWFSRPMESLSPRWELALPLTLTLLAIPIFAAIAILITASSLYGVQQLCQKQALSQSLGICDFAWTKPPTSILHTTPVGKTPMSTTIDELAALNDISPSLQFLGMPLFIINTNLSTSLSAIESDLNSTKFNSLTSGSLGQSATTAHQLVEQFSGRDFDFRHESSIWNAHGFADLSSNIEDLRILTFPDTSVPALSFGKSLWKNEPLFAGNTFNYELLSHYHNFVKHHLNSIEDLATSAIETKLALQDFLGHIGKLETKLIKTSHPEHAESLSIMRISAMWSLQVVQLASDHYKNIFTSLHALAAPLEAELGKHESWWGRFVWKNDVSVSRLHAIITAESGQLAELSAKSLRTQDVMDKVLAEYQESEEAQARVRWKLEEAAREGRVEWL